MHRREGIISAAVVLAMSVQHARGQSEVVVGLPVPEDGSGVSVGQILTLPMTMTNPSATVCALDVTMSCAGCSDYHVRSVTLNPAFSLVITEELISPPEGPAMMYHTCRAQPAETIDLALGADGVPIELGVIELEVLSDAAVLAPLSITAKVATIGRNPQPTVVYITDGTNVLNADLAPSDTAQIFVTPPAEIGAASPAEPVEQPAEAQPVEGQAAQGAQAESESAVPVLTQDEIDTLTAAVQSACADANLDSAECEALLNSVLPAGGP